MSSYYVYIVRCSDGSLYTGQTNDLKKRLFDHNSSDFGAKYTKGRRPVELVYKEAYKSRSEALKREYEIKNLKKVLKESLII